MKTNEEKIFDKAIKEITDKKIITAETEAAKLVINLCNSPETQSNPEMVAAIAKLLESLSK